ncbi:MAG: hybrid sensor histidine kinase/response regulator [Massilia sp.]|nr:hybrid sensor histidine kinase/response regulator [Massilia sp.]
MSNEAKIAAGQAVTAPSLQALHDQEVAVLRATISQLLAMLEAHASETDKAAGLETLVLQLQNANQHLVLATFGAQDRQAEAEAANLRQTEFLSMLAHELRNPLQPMAMANDLLADITGLHPTIASVHGVYKRQVTHMVRLVDDLLDASRVSSGKINLQLAPVLLSDIIDDAVETSRAGIERRYQQLQVRLPAAALVIEGDQVRLAQVFSNLLINASKFTHEYGHLEVSAKRVGNTVEIAVSDDGAGIQPELQPFIFDLFTQGFRSLERAQGGLGIGLSLVRTISQMHGGTVSVSSAGSAQGSTFVVTLPLSTQSEQRSGAPAQVPVAAPCKILLIEDNLDGNDVMTMLLERDGHSVTSCFDGPSGLRAGLSQSYDVVLCDIGLPGMDGYQVVAALRAALGAPLPCFVATTGYSGTDQPDRAGAAGFDHYLVKPVSLPALTGIIAAHAKQLRIPSQRGGDPVKLPKKY